MRITRKKVECHGQEEDGKDLMRGQV